VHMKTWMPLRASRRERADCGPKRRAIARLALGAGCQHVHTFCVSVRGLLEMLRHIGAAGPGFTDTPCERFDPSDWGGARLASMAENYGIAA